MENTLHRAHIATQQGRYREALDLLADEAAQARPSKGALELCALCAWNCNDFAAALVYFARCAELYEDSPRLMQNRLSCLCKLKRLDAAEALGQRMIETGSVHEEFDLYDNLSTVAARKGDFAASIRYGGRALTALDQSIPEVLPQKLPARKKFNPNTPQKNIISFSLWGNRQRYLRGAVRNALLAPDIYPSWTCRFYLDDSVPKDIQDLLGELGAQVVKMPAAKTSFLGLGWRFQVWDDPDVDFCLLRDADSVISPFEACAVNAWLASDAWFHIMRCWYTHTDLILAGMWGGATGALHEIYAAYRDTVQNQLLTRTADQQFLRRHVWPAIKYHTLIHDRYTRTPGSLPFPHAEMMPGDWHVGINEAAGAVPRQEASLRAYFHRAPSLKPMIMTLKVSV